MTWFHVFVDLRTIIVLGLVFVCLLLFGIIWIAERIAAFVNPRKRSSKPSSSDVSPWAVAPKPQQESKN